MLQVAARLSKGVLLQTSPGSGRCRCLAACKPFWRDVPVASQCTLRTAATRATRRDVSISYSLTTDRPTPTDDAAATSDEEEPPTMCNAVCSIRGVLGQDAESFCDAMLTLGAQAAWIEEVVPDGEEEEELFADPEPGPDARWLKAVWCNCRIVTLFEPDLDPVSMEMMISEGAEIAGVDGGLELQWSAIYDQDWEEQIRASYVPVQLTDDLWIVPEWCQAPDPTKTNIRLKPGLAFGTGEHPTTRLCLRWLQSQSLEGLNVMDYGAGSGILSVAALMGGAGAVSAVDVDPLSVRATTLNAELNNVQDRIEIYLAKPFSDSPEPLATAGACVRSNFDVCIANILKPALVDLCPRLTEYVRPGGTIVLSGVLIHQAHEIRELYAEEFADLKIITEGEWALVTGVRRMAPWKNRDTCVVY